MRIDEREGSEMSDRSLRAKVDDVPVARPANPALASVEAIDEAESLARKWLTPASVKGLGASFTMHGLLLLVMALWVLTPKREPVKPIDSRLAGSEMGVEDGLSATGGLNTPIELSASPEPPPEPIAGVFSPLKLESLEPNLSNLTGADKASGGGGMDNPNPGAGDGDGFGLARFGQGGELIRGVEVKVGDPQFTLLWDSEADLDLHVIEPGGKEIFWDDPQGKQGGELDVDNTRGFGPENVYWLHVDDATGRKVKGAGPPGEYKWYVHYWGGFGGIARPTRWKVRVKHNNRVQVYTGRFRSLDEKSKIHSLTVEGSAGAEKDVAARR
jgi:hypothetical protein